MITASIVDTAKQSFLKTELSQLLRQLKADAKGSWGVMNAQQMVEHFVDAVKNASGKLRLPIVNEGEKLEKFRMFLFSEKPFHPNTKNPLLKDEPFPLRKPDLESAILKLESEMDYFFAVFEADPRKTTFNPFFGELDFAGNVQLLHKHATHHLRQFGLYN